MKKGRAAGMPNKLARKYRAVYGQNANHFHDSWNEDLEPDIRNGIVYKEKLGSDTMAFMPDGTLRVFRRGRNDYSIDAFPSLGIENTFSFGPILVAGGRIVDGLPDHKLFRNNPRSAFGMVENGHYVGILVDGRKPGISRGVTLERLAPGIRRPGLRDRL